MAMACLVFAGLFEVVLVPVWCLPGLWGPGPPAARDPRDPLEQALMK
jgi:NADH:ubiquinone oxidoreductase subunit 4 (subunit M)